MKIKSKTNLKQEREGIGPEWKNLLFNMAFSIVAILIVLIFYEQILLAAFLEATLGMIGLLKWKSKTTLILFIVGGIWGTLAEMIIIYFSGAWMYKAPSVLNIIPLWLIFIWANTAAYIYETGKELKKLEKKNYGIKRKVKN